MLPKTDKACPRAVSMRAVAQEGWRPPGGGRWYQICLRVCMDPQTLVYAVSALGLTGGAAGLLAFALRPPPPSEADEGASAGARTRAEDDARAGPREFSPPRS